ncbi:MAG: hypothetical protein ACK57Y_05790 [Pirellulaceae bacterium]
MSVEPLRSGRDADLLQVLGYLCFSSAPADVNTLQAFNRLYGEAIHGVGNDPAPGLVSPFAGQPAWLTLQQWMQDYLVQLSNQEGPFRHAIQGQEVLSLVWLHLLPEYLDFHRDLLFHQEPEGVFNGFFLARAVEAVVLQGGPWDERDRIVSGAIGRLNNFVGYRPIAVLEGKKFEPYQHEWISPIPLYIRGAGVAFGVYHGVITETLKLLAETPQELLHAAYFDIENVDELSLDPRAYDFDHPSNKRPNHHFGHWDPDTVDEKGLYRRFIIQQVTIDALLSRIHALRESRGEGSPSEWLTEAAAVLAGTILMASTICGAGPLTHDSSVTLASLLDPVARNRDQFYDLLLKEIRGTHGARLKVEAKVRRQSFGGARQHLNTQLAILRGSQVEHVLLARLFARMGSSLTAMEESDHVRVPSARLLCRIDCLLTCGLQELRRGDLKRALEVPGQVRGLLERGIACGAIVDPWNLLGFGGNFQRSSGPDASVVDHRAEDLVTLMEQIFSFQSRLWREAAAQDDTQACDRAELEFQSLANWWRKYAAHQVQDLNATDPEESLQSAQLVARALRLWCRGGAATGDVRFWAQHADIFDSPKAYALVVEALLERRDFVASQALLVHWLSEAERVGLWSGKTAFPDLARLWMDSLMRLEIESPESLPSNATAAIDEAQRWGLIERFFACLEANGGEYFQPVQFRLGTPRPPSSAPSDDLSKGPPTSPDDASWDTGQEMEESEESTDKELFKSAYDDVVYEDSTADGVDSSLFEVDTESQDSLVREARRISQHLEFQEAMATMWRQVAMLRPAACRDVDGAQQDHRREMLQEWGQQASLCRRNLLELLSQVHAYRIPKGGSDPDSMSLFDQKRVTKESLVEAIVHATVEVSDAMLLLLSSIHSESGAVDSSAMRGGELDEEQRMGIRMFSALMAGEPQVLGEIFPEYLKLLKQKALLYVPLVRGGDPQEIFRVRFRRRMLTHLLRWLPRQGCFQESIQLLEAARKMENRNPVGDGAVTEFDELFRIAFKAMVEAVIRNAYAWAWETERSQSEGPDRQRRGNRDPADPMVGIEQLMEDGWSEPEPQKLIPWLERLTETLLATWLSHARTLRLSGLEGVDQLKAWKHLVSFIESYGAGLFTQQFLRLGNVRAILHQGVSAWLRQAKEEGASEGVERLLQAIDDGKIERLEAVQWLTAVLEVIIDHYAEYRDYNSTTTQSDRGEMLYMLLDFLRLRVRYDRVHWNLKPVFWAHEVLVRCGCSRAASQWQDALAERISKEADQYQSQLVKLQEKYAMRMPTIADRIGERFVRPMTIDRIRAYVAPAMKGLADDPRGEPSQAFQELVRETHDLMRKPTGVGFEVPSWLQALEEEVDRVLAHQRGFLPEALAMRQVPWILLSHPQFEARVAAATKQSKLLP